MDGCPEQWIVIGVDCERKRDEMKRKEKKNTFLLRLDYDFVCMLYVRLDGLWFMVRLLD